MRRRLHHHHLSAATSALLSANNASLPSSSSSVGFALRTSSTASPAPVNKKKTSGSNTKTQTDEASGGGAAEKQLDELLEQHKSSLSLDHGLHRLKNSSLADRLKAADKYVRESAYVSTRREKWREEYGKVKSDKLTFKDVDDSTVLRGWRDAFSWVYMIRHGEEYVLDDELSQMMGYSAAKATRELRFLEDHGETGNKLFTGPMTLSKTGVPFPAVTAFKLSNFTPSNYKSEYLKRRFGIGMGAAANKNKHTTSSGDGDDAESANSTSKNQTSSNVGGGGGSSAVKESMSMEFEMKSNSGILGVYEGASVVAATPSTIKRPTVVLFGQFGQKVSGDCDLAWRNAVYSYVNPELVSEKLPHASVADFPTVNNKDGDESQSADEAKLMKQRAGSAKKCGSSSGASSRGKGRPIDVISLRSFDLQTYAWYQRYILGRFLKYGNYSDNTLATTLIGPKLLKPFFDHVGLRNYMVPYCMLVDHKGRIRWLSSGMPQAAELKVLPQLLQQLETDYLRNSK